MPVEVTENYIRIRQRDPGDFEEGSFRTVTLSKSKGIKAIMGKLKGETTMTVQSYLFDKEKWTKEEAQKWITEHKKKSVFIKSIDDDKVIIGGYAAIWGSEEDRDLEGEYFTKETDFWIDKIPGPKPVLYEHGQHPSTKFTILGFTTKFSADDIGLSLEAELDRHNKYIETVLELAEQGKLGWSSGAVAHLVEKMGGQLKSWPIAEMTLTVIPAEPRLLNTEILNKIYGDNPPQEFVQVGETIELSEAKQSPENAGEKIALITALLEIFERLKG